MLSQSQTHIKTLWQINQSFHKCREKLHDSPLEISTEMQKKYFRKMKQSMWRLRLFSVFYIKVIYARHQINWHLQFTSWEIFLYLVEMECVGGSWDWDMANWQWEINSVPGKLVSNHEDLLFFLNLSNLGGGLNLVFFSSETSGV